MLKYEEFLNDNLKEINFEEAFDIEELQELQDVLATSLNIASIITDLDGRPITEPSQFCALCSKYVRPAEEGLKMCMKSDALIGAGHLGGYTVSKCLSAGLLDVSVAIKVGDKHVANWLFGQVRDEFDTVDEVALREKARELNADEDEFIEAYKQTPVIPRERFESIARLVYIISKQLADQAYQGCMRKAEEKYRKLLDDEMARQKELAEHASYIDELTKVNNRSYFEKQVEKLDFLGTVPVAVIVGDINNLKLTNDIFGHRHGDILISQIAQVLQDESFDDYIICRCGGDEFYILIPNANRQDADWYCRRVRLELDKKFYCCVKPSIAFGVAKKSNPQERIKTIMEFADLKMYRNKIQMKEQEDMLNNMKMVLIGRGYCSSESFTESISMARRFGEYLGYEEREVKRLTRVVKIQDFGMLSLTPELFARRFEKKLPLELWREVMKHPTYSSRIAGVNTHYAELSDIVLAHEERWDGTGYPNGLAGEKIPLLARLSKIVGDYQLALNEPPIGMGKTKEEAVQMLLEDSGKAYDPEYTRKFLEFLEQDAGVTVEDTGRRGQM